MEDTSAEVTYKELLTNSQNLKPLIISLVLMLGQQLSGVNAILFFR